MTAWMNTRPYTLSITVYIVFTAYCTAYFFSLLIPRALFMKMVLMRINDWMNYVRCQWFPIFCLLLIALLIFLCLFFAYCLCCFTCVYCSQSRDIASAKIRILQILWQWIVMALVVYLLVYLCIRSWAECSRRIAMVLLIRCDTIRYEMLF